MLRCCGYLDNALEFRYPGCHKYCFPTHCSNQGRADLILLATCTSCPPIVVIFYGNASCDNNDHEVRSRNRDARL